MSDTRTLREGWLQSYVDAEQAVEPEVVTKPAAKKPAKRRKPKPPVITDPEPEPDAPEPPIIESFWRRRWPRLAIGLVALMLLAWAGLAQSQSKYLIGSQRLATRSSKALFNRELQHQAQGYRLTLTYPSGVKKQYQLNQLGLTVDTDQTLKAARTQASFGRKLQWWKPIPVTVRYTTDATVFNGFVAREATVIVQPPKDAVLQIDNGKITIPDAVTGTQYGLPNAKAALTAATANLTKREIKLSALTVSPPLTPTMLTPYKASLEKTLNQTISFQISDRTVTATPAVIAQWLEITPNDTTHTVDISVNSGKVQSYIDTIAARSIRPAKAQIQSQQADGSTRVIHR